MSVRAQNGNQLRGNQARSTSSRPARRRPAARRNPDSNAGRIQWDRLGRVLLVLLVAGLLISYIGPLVNLAKTYRSAGATKVQLHQVQAKNDLLERRVDHIKGDAVLQREARSQGMINPGETPYVVNGIKP